MPTAVPGMSIGEATRILQIQDRLIKRIPEVATVFGQAGQAETPTDPAPLSMFETVVALKPHEQWRPGMTWEKIIAEMNAELVGLIALAGLDAETGVVMLLYLDHAWDKFKAAGRLNTPADLHDAIIEGAVRADWERSVSR